MRLEEWHAFIAAHLPTPVAEQVAGPHETWFTGGDPGEVVVRLRHATVTVFEYALVQDEDGMVVRPRRVGSLCAAGVDEGRAMAVVQQLIAIARDKRQGRYRACANCGDRQPPEYLSAGQVCVRCGPEPVHRVH